MRLLKIIIAVAVGAYCAALIYILSFAWKPNIPQHADAALVLGAKVYLDNTPSDPLYQRTLTAVNLYQQHKVDYIIATGGVGLGPAPESAVSEQIAAQNGVPANKVLSEDESHDTFENIEDIQNIAQKYKIQSLIIVSDRFHVARGVFVAKHFGYGPIYWDFPNQNYYPTNLLIWDYAREAAALLYYIPKTILTPAN